ncbi:MAG: trigger factor [Eubacteriales bacterium]|nr:trigger factor [Eubacteriales bacterium]
MSVQMEKTENNQAKLTITVDNATFDAAIKAVYAKNAKKYSIPGFRPGKAPFAAVKAHYGEIVFWDDAFNEVFPPAYEAAIDELHLEPVDHPSVDIKDKNDEGVVFEALVTLKPEVTLGKYTGIRMKGAAYTVTDEDVDKELEAARQKAARLIDVDDRAVASGDVVNLDYCGKVDGVAFEGGTAEGQTLEIGSGMFIPGFEEQMIGMAIGETKDLSVRFPDEYHAPELKGKDAVFTVKVNGIQVKELPELDDEFAKDVSECDTLEAYKAEIRGRLEEENAKRKERDDDNKLVEKIVKNATVDIPACMTDRQIDYMIREFEYSLMYQGMRLADYLKMIGKTRDELRDEYRAEAERRVKIQLVMEQIQKEAEIKAEQEDIDTEIAKRAERANKPVEEYKEHMHDHELEYITDQIVMDKTLAFIKAKNKITA